MSAEILIIDDNADIRLILDELIIDAGYKTRLAANFNQALTEIDKKLPDVAIIDVKLDKGDNDGILLLDHIKNKNPDLPVIMISGHANIEMAVNSLKSGAFEFIQKPFDKERLLNFVNRAVENYNLKNENKNLNSKLFHTFELVGKSSNILSIKDQINKLSKSESRIFISGPTGSGKELISRKIHKNSTRSKEPFVIINGPVFIGDNCLIKSHSNISKSIINHDCKVKGEVHTTIFQPFANKAHEGFLGHSFIASWVNLGAGTTTSNLKNNYSNISVKWNGELIDTKSIFFGSIIGEHVKTSIGTNLNTGTVIEMGCNIISQTFPPRYIPSFSFYYNGKISKITFDDFKDVASKAMSRRNVNFSSIESTIFDLYKKD